ncbi:hypothetical protein [Candidatus Macondimonas diazotrophica]|nr:hypothetical protein [Candidatus Macondimonas diazotrophica]
MTFNGDRPAAAALVAISGDERAIHVLLDLSNEQVETDFNDAFVDSDAC